MNAVQKRKAKKIAYRKLMRKKIIFIEHVQLDGMFGDQINGYDRRGRCYSHLTNFPHWKLKTYRMAIITFPGNSRQFGLADTTIAGNFEEGHCHKAPDMGALFVVGKVKMAPFWKHLNRIEDYLTRFTRRERQKDPSLKNDSFMRTFRRPPM